MLRDVLSRRRPALSCETCCKRKVKCVRLNDQSCRRCASLQEPCYTDYTKIQRPFYRTSKEQFELMKLLINHFLPGVPMETTELQAALASARNGSLHPPSVAEYAARHGASPQYPIDDCSHGQAEQAFDSQHDEMQSKGQTGVAPKSSIGGNPMVANRFDCDTSWNAFYAEARAIFSQSHESSLPQKHIALIRVPPENGHAGSLVLRGLPSRDSMQAAVDRFFAQVNSGTYILDHETFCTAVDRAYEPQGSITSSVALQIHMVYALSHNSRGFLDKAYEYLQETISEASPESVQGLMIMILWYINHFEGEPAYALMGCVVRIAQSLGLHLSQPKPTIPNPSAVQHKEMIWWSLFELETWLCLTLGRPPIIALETCTATLPADMGLKLSRNIPPGYLAQSARLCQLSGQVLEVMQRENNLTASASKEGPIVLQSLKAYKDNLPVYLRPECPTAPSFERANGYLELRYQLQIMIITRKCLLSPTCKNKDQTLFTSQTCVNANKASVEILKVWYKKGYLSGMNYMDSYAILVNAMIMIIRAIGSPSSEITLELESFMPLLSIIQNGQLSKYCLESFSMLYQIIRNTQEYEKLAVGETWDIHTMLSGFDHMFTTFWGTSEFGEHGFL